MQLSLSKGSRKSSFTFVKPKQCTNVWNRMKSVLMDEQKESEAVEELTRAIVFKPDLQILHLRAAFHESIGDVSSALQDCQAALCMDPNHTDTLDLYNRARD